MAELRHWIISLWNKRSWCSRHYRRIWQTVNEPELVTDFSPKVKNTSWASQVAQWIKKNLQCRRCMFDPWVEKITLRRAWKPTSIFLPGESHGWRCLPGYSSWGRKESDMIETSMHTFKNISYMFLKAVKKIIINRILWNMKIICKSKLGVPEEGFISMPSWSLICVLSTTVFMLQQQCWEAALATVWLSKIKLFRSFPFRGKKIGRPPYYTSGFQTWVCTRTSWVTWSTQMLSLISRGHNLAGFGVTWASHF